LVGTIAASTGPVSAGALRIPDTLSFLIEDGILAQDQQPEIPATGSGGADMSGLIGRAIASIPLMPLPKRAMASR
jgi:hypothetical protein